MPLQQSPSVNFTFSYADGVERNLKIKGKQVADNLYLLDYPGVPKRQLPRCGLDRRCVS